MSFSSAPATSGPVEDHERYEEYRHLGANVSRTVSGHRTLVGHHGKRPSDPFCDYWKAWLTCPPPPFLKAVRTVTAADLFSGCGGLSVGIREACNALGLNEEVVLAADFSPEALAVFDSNFSPQRTHGGPIEALIDGELGGKLTRSERRLAAELDGLTIAVGGPPCQGNSDLNNHTRRRDPKNALYLKMVRFVEVVRPEHVIIENVPGVIHDRGGVVSTASDRLSELGYAVSDGVLAADLLGAAQRRRRHIMLASLSGSPSVEGIALYCKRAPNPVMWAIDDLEMMEPRSAFDTAARHSGTNRKRIDFLFDNDLYELPDEERPDCHRLKSHSYRSVYGRMRPDEPAPTITSGFGSTGQGRFVHPHKRRTLTPHEAARLQGFPDWFDFSSCEKRTALQAMIGNAVPSRLGYVAALEVLG